MTPPPANTRMSPIAVRMRGSGLSPLVRGPHPAQVDLRHRHHRGHYPIGPRPVFVPDHLEQHSRAYLPRQPVLVLEPPALAVLAPRRQPLPEIVDLLLRLALHQQR